MTKEKISRTFEWVSIVFESFWTRSTKFGRNIFISKFFLVSVIFYSLNIMTCICPGLFASYPLCSRKHLGSSVEKFCVISHFHIRNFSERLKPNTFSSWFSRCVECSENSRTKFSALQDQWKIAIMSIFGRKSQKFLKDMFIDIMFNLWMSFIINLNQTVR